MTKSGMLALPPPYGWDAWCFASLTLKCDKPPDPDKLTAALRRYSCHEPAIPRIQNCLRYSGHYECYLQLTWVRSSYRRATADFKAIGVEFIVNYFREGERITYPI